MLSAQKQEMPNDSAQQSSHTPVASGFGKVLNSIQGLQQRLDDFSVEEVSRAHAKAHDLIRQLAALQTELSAIAKLKEVLALADDEIRAIPEYNFALVDTDNLESHPQLRAIVQASKVIRMHRLLRAARASADAVSFDLQTLSSGSEISPPIAPPESLSEVSSQPAALLVTSPDGDARASASAESPPESSGNKFLPLSGSPEAPNFQPTRYEFAELKLEEARPSRRNDDWVLAEKPESQVALKVDPTPFDKRLLNDLIESYGEFTLSTASGSTTGSTSKELMVPDEVLPAPHSMPPIDSATSTPTSSQAFGTELILRESASVETAHSQSPSMSDGPLTLPAPDEESNRLASDSAISKSNSRGEIDRQLKNIIKDYGEYDLYSHQKKTSSKTAAIAAVAALGLALGGWYFFIAPPPTEPTPVEIMMPAGTVDTEPSSGAKLNLQQKK